ncbi:MAG: hypothetical protein WC736_15500 [Gallionella sp.]
MNRHLTGWKAIGAHLGMSASGAKRRTKKGLPVYREEGKIPWAIASELDEWRRKMSGGEMVGSR